MSHSNTTIPRSRMASILGGSIGNLIEWYDFYIYNFLALYFSKAFFPNSDPTAQLLNTFGIYAIGFLIRPVGGWLLGVYADRAGRRAALSLSVTLMCVGSLIIALAPTFKQAGIIAPLLLLAARLLQGLSLGGEYGASATYLSEISGEKNRGFYSSFQYVTLIAGQLLATLTLLVLQQFVLSGAELQAWGWRLFRLPGLWLSLALALLLVMPVLWWNATHDWISLAYQAGHAAGQREWRPVRLLAFVLVQLLAYGLLPAAGLLLAARRFRAASSPPAPHGGPRLALVFAAAFGLPALATFVYLSGRGTTLPHWSAFVWIALLPAAAWGADSMWRRARHWLAAWQVLGCLVLATLMLSAGFASEEGAQMRSLPGERTQSAPRNPFADLHGWEAGATRAAQLAADNQVKVLAVMKSTLPAGQWTPLTGNATSSTCGSARCNVVIRCFWWTGR